MTQTQAQKLVDKALNLKLKKDKAEARYEKRRKRYQDLHKKITGLISVLTTPIMAELDQIKLVLEEWRTNNLIESDALNGVTWRRGPYAVTGVDLKQLILASVFVDPETGEVTVEDTSYLQPNDAVIKKRVSTMELLHGIPGVTVKKQNDTMVLSGKKDK